jgi:hypothetical protein
MSANKLEFDNDVFDTVVMYGNNFGVAGNEKQIVAMLRALHKITTPDGIILAGSADPLNTDNEEHLKYHEMNRARNRPPGFVRIRVMYAGYVSDWSDLWLLTPSEMEVIAEKGGWQVDKIYQTGRINQSSYVGILSKKWTS